MFGVKKFFRFLRGELNGFYLTRLAYVVNSWSDKYLNKVLCYMRNVQFDLESMKSSDIMNLAKFAGITQVLSVGQLTADTLFLTESEIRVQQKNACFIIQDNKLVINQGKTYNEEISERGLFDPVLEEFNFDFYNSDKPDIVDNITPENKLQASLIPHGAKAKGWIREGAILYDKDGNFIEEAIEHGTPPEGIAYTDYYGKEYLHLGEKYSIYRIIPINILFEVFLIIQRIRYNGISIKTFAELTNALVGDFITLTDSKFNSEFPSCINWFYKNKEGIQVKNRLVKLDTWKNLTASYFPQIILEEAI